jgi:hypothetical protein
MQSERSVYTSVSADGFARQLNLKAWALLVNMVAFACLVASEPAFAHENHQTASANAIPGSVDPNKGPSEFNHHIAGWALIGIGVLALADLLSSRIKARGYIWPVLFILAGLFIALWSDGEIWPRGNLSWSWLLQHDAEARQHKIYSVLLIAIGTIEYFRMRGSLPRFWRAWAFPIIAALGASMLLIHDHTAGSGVNLPEAQAYLVNPDLDVNGNPRVLSLTATAASITDDCHMHMQHGCASATDASTMDAAAMPMNHSQMKMDVFPASLVPASHGHLMTPAMIRVEHQHFWFMIVGLAIGLFKFISDSEMFRGRFLPSIWPSCMVMLGLMLVFYRE